MEYAGGGELGDHVRENHGLSEVETRNIIRQVAQAIQVCHSYGVVHRDLKLENVLFESQAKTKIKVVDFGIAGLITNLKADKNTAATIKYMTPEMVTSGGVAAPSMDVWAIGIMAYVMMFNRLPFNGDNKKEIKEAITKQEHKIPQGKIVSHDCQ